jgi:hypothetical protein
MRHLLKISLVLFLGGITVLQAQEGSGLDTEDITVVKDYEARIADAQKINVNPKVADVELPAPELSYCTKSFAGVKIPST